MAGVRKALIVATDQYSDPKLTQLNAPAEDARALAEVLQDPDVGHYDVQTVLNKTCQEVEIAIASFFQSGARDDTLLLHFSCHGVKDLSGELYFATIDTKLPLLKVTGVSSSMVKHAMEESRASLILCLVDCCYSGAFTKSTKAAATVDLTERLGGRGRAVITASTSLQLALDGQEEPSLFTHAVLEGLRSGDADRDLDGLVTLDEFYNYIHDKVTEKNPDQTPVKSFDVQGEVYVARRGAPITTPAPLPRDVVDWLATGEDWQRLGAVSRLSDLLNAGHPGRALGARQALEKVRDNDDSFKVRKAAEAVLEGAGDTEAIPLIPDYVESLATAGAKSATTSVEEVTVADTASTDTATPDTALPETPADTVSDGLAVETGTDRGLTTLTGGLSGETVKDLPVVPEELSGGAGGGSAPPEPGNRWGKWIIMGAGAAAAVVALFFVGLWLGGEDDKQTDDSLPDEPGLSPTELIVPVRPSAGEPRVLKVVDVESGDSEVLLDGTSRNQVDLPTLDVDGRWMSFIRDVDADGTTHRVAFRAEVDPFSEGATPLLDSYARDSCPSSSRPAVSFDGGKVALNCRYSGNSWSGLYVAELDGTHITEDGLRPLLEDSGVRESPTWNGKNEVIISLAAGGPDGDRTILVSIPWEGGEPKWLTDGSAGWDSSPDWSDEAQALLFLRSSDSRHSGIVCMLKDGKVRRLTKLENADVPTWSPDGRQIAYLAPDESGTKSLFVQNAVPGAEPRKIDVGGIPGPPAWGPR